MAYFTSNTYKMKRKILSFSNKISKRLTKPQQKFTADITYGILASGSCLLTDVADQLHEDSRKINTVGHLSRHLSVGIPAEAASAYLKTGDLRKGKIKMNLFYRGKNREAYLSHVKVQIISSRKNIYLVLVYGITEHPMMLATNKEVRSKEDVIKVAGTYFSRWRIEEKTLINQQPLFTGII